MQLVLYGVLTYVVTKYLDKYVNTRIDKKNSTIKANEEPPILNDLQKVHQQKLNNLLSIRNFVMQNKNLFEYSKNAHGVQMGAQALLASCKLYNNLHACSHSKISEHKKIGSAEFSTLPIF